MLHLLPDDLISKINKIVHDDNMLLVYQMTSTIYADVAKEQEKWRFIKKLFPTPNKFITRKINFTRDCLYQYQEQYHPPEDWKDKFYELEDFLHSYKHEM